MRKLKTKDIGPFSKIISKMDIKKEIMELFTATDGLSEKEKAIVSQTLIIRLVYLVLENYWKAETEFYKLISSLTGYSVTEVENLPPKEMLDILKQIAEDESFTAFFNAAP